MYKVRKDITLPVWSKRRLLLCEKSPEQGESGLKYGQQTGLDNESGQRRPRGGPRVSG